jgi:hypothetical protein
VTFLAKLKLLWALFRGLPAVFTTKGNIPLDGLEHKVEWQVSQQRIIFTESYLLNGEVVKQSSHVKLLIGSAGVGEAFI